MRPVMVPRHPISILTIMLSLAACSDSPPGSYSYSPPENVGDGFEVSPAAEAGVDPEPLEAAVEAVRAGIYSEVHSILVYRDGRLVFEEYFEGHDHYWPAEAHHGELLTWDRERLHNAMSVTKSVTSACIGIAVDRGLIDSVERPISAYLPGYRHLLIGGREALTIEHLLTMTAGLGWNEWALPYSDPMNDAVRIYGVEDPVAFILEKPLDFKPGRAFNYAGGCNHLLGEVLRNASGMSIDDFSGKYLFTPLDIETYRWTRFPSGVVEAAGSLMLRPRDMLKIGVTFLEGGSWKGRRIISAEWVAKSGTPYEGNSWVNDWDDHYGLRGYGYSWWTHHFSWHDRKIDMYYAAGWGGQYIMVIPALDAAVVFTGGNYTTKRPCFEILKTYILPSFIDRG